MTCSKRTPRTSFGASCKRADSRADRTCPLQGGRSVARGAERNDRARPSGRIRGGPMAAGAPAGRMPRNSPRQGVAAGRGMPCTESRTAGSGGRGRRRAGRDDQGAAGIRPVRLPQGPGHVDHTPDTGKVRGVRCINCNSALGKLRDDPDAMRRAIAYLEGNVWKPILEAPGVYQLPS
ncbi:endonuclease domain-containing protein [Streptomyces sp. WAC01526]|uniref:endonuclease domain-containing protein n=1 Tax=Streptomyces sp. WAC01526 TaxID=2588709 RepID=UPI0011DF8B4C|nr:endonuclease domain-containing protein [Streptomyces sp. WAC01526]